MTSDVASSSLCAGKQCMNSALDLACDSSSYLLDMALVDYGAVLLQIEDHAY